MAVPEAPASAWTPPRAGLADLAGQAGDVLDDLHRFVAAPLLRRRHLTWGATRAEAAAAMPGDRLLPHAQYRSTRAITVAAPPERVWPWLVQVGLGRGGWYADDLLDNLARPSAREIVPELQDLRVGRRLPMFPHPAERAAVVVDGFAEPSWLLWRAPNRTWAWRLTPLSDGRTRLVTRMHTLYEWRRPLTPVTVLLMEFADYPMMRRMLLGIRARAEA
ncbi:hypothetical protein [Actinocorallia herbida]|uniref:hypothetical protein n=1 Tax=Actinocorallia herbida TaxID=58109 RepID=UPI001B860399|nr:hypothetical protein [Actinocorallia herbida]